MTITAREFLRVSVDKSGRQRSIEEQHQDNLRDAEDGGWVLGEAYREVGSASRYASKARKDFPGLMADLEAGRFGADMLVLWESSRGSRRTGEWCDLIDVCRERGVKIRVSTHRRTYDPANARDRRSLREDASDSEYESDKISDRALRASAANAADGKPHGRTPYGYVRRYHQRTGALVAQEPDPDEAPIVREMYERLRKGHSLRAIARDLKARGIRSRPYVVRDKASGEEATVPGRPFVEQTIRGLVLSRTYIGERVHKDEDPVPATWPALVDRTTWQAVHNRLTDPGRRTSRPGRAKHLLSMIGRCDVCSGPLTARGRQGRMLYTCQDLGHVKVDYGELDALAEAVILGYLSRPDNVERLTADDGDDERLREVRERIAAIQGELTDLADQVGAGTLSATLAARAEPRILERLEAAREDERDLTTPSVLRDLIEPGEDVALRWRAAPMSARREVARLLLAPDVLGQMRVTRGTRGHPVPVEQRVEWRKEG